MNKSKWIVGLLVLTLLVGSASAVWAQERAPGQAPGPKQRGPSQPGQPNANPMQAALGHKWATVPGEVTSVEAASFGLNTRRGELSVQVDDKTRFHFPEIEDAGLGDLTAGTKVLVGGMKNEDGSLLAWIVAALPERARLVQGQITAIKGATLTLATRSGDELTLLTDEETRFRLPGVQDPGLDCLSVDDAVSAKVEKQEDGSLYASVIGPSARPRPRQKTVRGQISAIEGNTITLNVGREAEREVTVLTDENTRFRLPGVQDPGLDDLEIEQLIVVNGQRNEDGSLQARVIRARPERPEDVPEGAPQVGPALP